MSTIKPWYAEVTPHRDIREGHLDESVFAANLWQTVLGKAPEVYRDPTLFFEKTYITVGLATVLRRVAAGLTGQAESGDRILSLQTSFGGGKTHTLVALWHLAKQELKIEGVDTKETTKVIAAPKSGKPTSVAVFTNQTCDPIQGREVGDGIGLRTLWGEIAWQLGGEELYKMVQPNDEQQIAPKGVFAKVLEQAAPCLILIDELADYTSAAAGVKVGSGSLADQTISFIQELTEAVQSVPNAVMVATLPASSQEVANSEVGEAVLSALQKRMGRMAADMKPVGDNEIYEVIRARLFDDIGSEEVRKAAVDSYVSMYQSHLGEVPDEVLRAEYKERMMRSYPFHPQIIETLHTRWGSHPDFQRTRGVLRLLAAIVADLWQRRNTTTQTQPLIQPCHLRFDIDPLIGQVTKLWGANWQTVIASDVVGSGSNAEKIDSERGGDYATERIVAGASTAICLGTFAGSAGKRGWGMQDIRLACSRPGLNWSYTDAAVSALKDAAFYLYTTSVGGQRERYWFAVKPTLNKLMVQYRQGIEQPVIDDTIISELKRQEAPAGTFTRIVVDPATDLPEQKGLTLLALGVKNSWEGKQNPEVRERILNISRSCGSKDRIYRNTLLFLVPHGRGLRNLEETIRDMLAYQRVRDDYSSQLDADELQELKDRIAELREKIGSALSSAYSVILRIGAKNKVEALELPNGVPTFTEHLQRVWQQLKDEEWVVSSVGPTTLKEAKMWPDKGQPVSVKEATDAFLRFTDKPMLADTTAVARGVTRLAKEHVVGIGYGGDADSLAHKEIGHDVSDVDPLDETAWMIPGFKDQLQGAGDVAAEAGTLAPAEQSASGEALGKEEQKSGKKYKRVKVHGRVPMEYWGDIYGSLIRPLMDKRPKIEITIEVEGEIDGATVDQRGIRESAEQIGLKVDADEED